MKGKSISVNENQLHDSQKKKNNNNNRMLDCDVTKHSNTEQILHNSGLGTKQKVKYYQLKTLSLL